MCVQVTLQPILLQSQARCCAEMEDDFCCRVLLKRVAGAVLLLQYLRDQDGPAQGTPGPSGAPCTVACKGNNNWRVVSPQEDEALLQDRRAGGVGAEASWASVHGALADPSAVAILPHGVDGHLVAEVVAGMRLQRSVLLTSQLHVRDAAPPLVHPGSCDTGFA